jgi:AcrR family transcriptional regulator
MASSTPTKKTPATRNSAGRRREILDCAAAVFARKGFASATVRDVADAAGILSGSLYHHFESKDQMLEEILREELDNLVRGYEAVVEAPDAEQGLRQLFDVAFEHIVRHPDANAIFQNDFAYLRSIPRFSFVVERNRAVRDIWTAMLSRGVEEGSFRSDLDVNIAYLTIMGAIASTVRWTRPKSLKSALETSHAMSHLFLAGILNR